MFLQKLLDPEEERRRRARRARIVRRNRIKRETAQGLPVRCPRVPRASNLALALDNESSHEDWEEPTSPFRPTFGGNSDQSQQHERAVAQVNQAVASAHPSVSFAKPPALLTEPQTPVNSTAALAKPPTSALILCDQPKKSESVAPHVRARWQRAFQQVVFKRHEEILTKDPNRKWRQERFGLLLYGHQEYERAAQHLSKAISLGSTSSLCWRRLAESYYHLWEQTSEWDVLWSCRTAFEQALTHVEVASSPVALFMYARVLQLLGSYTASLTVCALILQTFPAFKQLHEVKLRFVLLQRYQLFTSTSVDTAARGGSEFVAALGRETLLIKCIGYTQELLLDKAIVEGPLYLDVLYLHTRLNELLIETSTASASNTAAIAPEVQLARTSVGVLFQQLYKLASKEPRLAAPPGIKWRSWKTRNETYTAFAEYFRARGEVLLAADALCRSLELLEALPFASNSNGKAAKPWEGISEDQRRKRIAVYVVLGRNYYHCNQMEKATRAMEAVIQLDPLHAEARASLTAWFPAKWQYRLDLEDASQVQIARVLRGIWGRNRASQRRTEAQLQAERKYLESPYHAGSRRRVVRLLRSKYAALFAAQDLAARRIQHGTRRYLYYARIRWTLAAQRDKFLRDLRSKQQTRKYRYNRHVRSQLVQFLPEEYERRFALEDCSALRIQRCFRGERVRREFRRHRDLRREQFRRRFLAAQRIQRVFRRYRSNRLDNTLAVNKLTFHTHQQLMLLKARLAMLLQGLYHRWKAVTPRRRSTLLLVCQAGQEERHRVLKIHTSALKIQRLWRRYTAVKAVGGRRISQAHLLFVERFYVTQRRQTYVDVDWDHAARKIQTTFRRKLVQKLLAMLQTRPLAPANPSPIATLLATCEANQHKGIETLAVLHSLDTLTEKRALFDHSVVVLRGPRASSKSASPATNESFPLQHVVSAIQYSALLRCLICASGDFTGDRILSVLHASRTLRVLALGAIQIGPSRQTQEAKCGNGLAVEILESSEDRSMATPLRSPLNRLQPTPPPSPPPHQQRQLSPMQILSKALRTTNFLLEELYLERNALLERPHEGELVAEFVSDYFFGRYGRLHTLVVAHMRLSDANGALLGAALAINTVLQRLDLHGNVLCDNAAIAIANDGLAHNSTLRYLNLAENTIGSAGGKALFQCLGTRNRSLQTLIMCNNHLMNDVIPPLVEAWLVNSTIESVELAGNLIHDQELAEMEAASTERRDISVSSGNAELRLLLARKRFNGHDDSSLTSPKGLGISVTSPVKSGDLKKHKKKMPLSPKKWLSTNAPKLVSPLNHPVPVNRYPRGLHHTPGYPTDRLVVPKGSPYSLKTGSVTVQSTSKLTERP